MGMRLYLDTSVLGAEFDTESPERVQVTLELFDRLAAGHFGTCISPATLEEISQAPDRIRVSIEERLKTFDLEILTESVDTDRLVKAYIADGAVPEKNETDARHLAIATVHGVDALVSWNFRHMVNLMRRRRVHAVNLRLGRPLLEIVSPAELTDVEEDENGG